MQPMVQAVAIQHLAPLHQMAVVAGCLQMLRLHHLVEAVAVVLALLAALEIPQTHPHRKVIAVELVKAEAMIVLVVVVALALRELLARLVVLVAMEQHRL